MDPRSRLGRLSELVARNWLRLRGWRILSAGARWNGVQVDIVARRGSLVAVVEVKSRRRPYPVAPVGGRQLDRLERVARVLAGRRAFKKCVVRVDVLEVTWHRGLVPVVRHSADVGGSAGA